MGNYGDLQKWLTQQSRRSVVRAQSTISDYRQQRVIASTYSLSGCSFLKNRVHSGPEVSFSAVGVSVPSAVGPGPFAMIPKMSWTCSECITTVVVPAATASSAAISLVDMPPVPSDVPRVEVETGVSNGRWILILTLLLDFADIPHDGYWLSIGVDTGVIGIPGVKLHTRISSVVNAQAPHISQEEQIVRMDDCR